MSALDDLDVRTLGAKCDGSNDDTVAIQTACDLFVRNPGRWRRIVGQGVSKIKGTIVIANDDPGYNRIEIFGGQTAYNDSGAQLGGWVWIRQDAGDSTRLTQPMLILQGCLAGSITGITFVGPYSEIYDYAITQSRGLAVFYDKSYADLLGTAGYGDNVYGPQCAVAIGPFIGGTTKIASGSNNQALPQGTIYVASTDAFDASGVLRITPTGGTPQRVAYTGKNAGMTPNFTGCTGGTGTIHTNDVVTGTASPNGNTANRYPGLTDYYGGDKLTVPRGSTNVTFEHCNFMNCLYGVVISPTGSSLGQNDEAMLFDRCGWIYNRIALAIGESQARCTEIRSAAMVYNYLCFDSRIIGGGTGGAPTPTFSGFQNIGGCRYLFNLNTANGPLFFHDAYCEAISSFGFLGSLSNPGNAGGTIHDAQFLFMTAKSVKSGGTNKPEVQSHLIGSGLVELRNVVIDVGGRESPISIGNPNGRLFLDRARLFVGSVSTSAPGTVLCGFWSWKDVRSEYVHLLGTDGNAYFQDQPFGPGECRLSEATVDSNASLSLTQDGTNLAKGTFTMSALGSVGKGDLLCVRDYSAGAGHWYVKNADGTNDTSSDYFGPFGVVTDVNADTKVVTVEHIGDGFPFGNNLKLKRQRWLVQSVADDEYTAGETLNLGDAVYLKPVDGKIYRAQANSTNTMPAIGIVVEAQTLQGTARIATLGRGEIGSLSGLGSTPTAQYVSAADAGKLVTTAPMTAGNVVQLVGISKNDTTLVPVSYYVNV